VDELGSEGRLRGVLVGGEGGGLLGTWPRLWCSKGFWIFGGVFDSFCPRFWFFSLLLVFFSADFSFPEEKRNFPSY